jgi:fructosamine-3-kinase
MWQTIEKAIEEATNKPYSIVQQKISTNENNSLIYWISDNDKQYFVKIKNKDQLSHFESEIYGLEQLSASQCVTCPQVITSGITLDKSFLVLDYIIFDKPVEKDWYQLGVQIALMHRCVNHGQFGWQYDNYIGDTLQPNHWQSNWRTFFAEQRIAWQLQLLNEKSINLGDIEFITEVCHDALLHHQVTPCLVHGDLWQGNLGFCEHVPLVFDPACYYGDREVDLAMTELFGQLPENFYQGYHETFPISESYQQRKLIYNFYHILNHANLFGGLYIEQSKITLSQILAHH